MLGLGLGKQWWWWWRQQQRTRWKPEAKTFLQEKDWHLTGWERLQKMDETAKNNKEYRWQGSYQQNGPKNLLNDHWVLKKLQKDGVNVSSEIADADIIDVPDSDNENNNNYVDLDTVGGGVFEAWQQLRSSFFIFAQVIVFPYNYM